LNGGKDGKPDRGMSWLVDKIRKGERIEDDVSEPLFENVQDAIPLFLHTTLLDSLHDMWRLNSEKLIYRLGVIMGHKLRVELGERLDLEEVGSWEAAIEQVKKMLEILVEGVEVTKVARLFARFEGRGCPCRKMNFTLDYCPQDMLIVGIMVGFAQRTLDDPNIFGNLRTCCNEENEELCVYELQIQEKDVPKTTAPGMPT
jgi:hypothetical protein